MKLKCTLSKVLPPQLHRSSSKLHYSSAMRQSGNW